MGQPITVTVRPGVRSDVKHFELNRSLTGMQTHRYQSGEAISGTNALRNLWGTPACYGTALQFAEYCRKYGKTHDMVAPFIVNSRRNGLLFPEGYWAQHRPES